VSEVNSLDLDLLFGHSAEQYRVRVLRSPAGEGQTVAFGRPFADSELKRFLLSAGRFRSRAQAESIPVASAKELGGRLFDAVFAGSVAECLRRSVDQAEAGRLPLRILLRLADCPELAYLPWELLYDHDDDSFLALSGQTPVVRYVELRAKPRPVPTELPLRVLVIRSEPSDCAHLNLSAEWAQVDAALSALSVAGMVEHTELAAATLEELRKALLRETFHVLHFMGHGTFHDNIGGALLFTGASGIGQPVTGGDLGVLLRDHSSLRLAVLNACQAGRTDPSDQFAGVADTLVRRGIPAVIAMQFEVSDIAAVAFAPALYGALAAGRPVHTALAEARKAIYTVSRLEWATPVLYSRAGDAQLFHISRQRSNPDPVRTQQAGNPQARPGSYRDRHEAESREAIRLNPLSPEAHTSLGNALNNQGRLIDAEAEFGEAIRLDPGNAGAHAGLAGALNNAGRLQEAEAACLEAIRLNPALAWAHAMLGAVLRNAGRLQEAEAACLEAIRLDQSLDWAHATLGAILGGLRRFPEAEAECREAIRLGAANAFAHATLGDILNDLGRPGEAEESYREAIRLNPSNAWAYSGLGLALNNLGRVEEAQECFRESRHLDSERTPS
jgi:tetratricopeptide (TPR) repeat protein